MYIYLVIGLYYECEHHPLETAPIAPLFSNCLEDLSLNLLAEIHPAASLNVVALYMKLLPSFFLVGNPSSLLSLP